jgi:hypothetical protein
VGVAWVGIVNIREVGEVVRELLLTSSFLLSIYSLSFSSPCYSFSSPYSFPPLAFVVPVTILVTDHVM